MFAVGGFLTWCAPGASEYPGEPLEGRKLPPEFTATLSTISDGQAIRLALYGAPVAVNRILRSSRMFGGILDPWPDFVTAPTLIRIAAAVLFRSAHGELLTYGPYEGDYDAGDTVTLVGVEPFLKSKQSPWPESGYAYFRDFGGAIDETAVGSFSEILLAMIEHRCGCARCARPASSQHKKGA